LAASCDSSGKERTHQKHRQAAAAAAAAATMQQKRIWVAMPTHRSDRLRFSRASPTVAPVDPFLAPIWRNTIA